MNRFFLLAFLFLSHLPSFGQEKTRPAHQHLIGLDLLKNISMNLFDARRYGSHFEFIAKPFYHKRVHPYISGGMGKVRSVNFFPNVDYRCNGWFLRSGLELDVVPPGSLRVMAGFGLLYSHGASQTRYIIPGNYFPDYERKVNLQFDHLALQAHLTVPVKIYQQLEANLILCGSGFLTSVRKNSEERFSYFTPGLGFHRDFRIYPDFMIHLCYKLP